MPAKREQTARFLRRVKQALTGAPSKLEQACQKKLDSAEEILRLQLARGEISLAEAARETEKFAKLNGKQADA